MTSVNLAKALAAAGLRVVLVDADFRRPAVAPSSVRVKPAGSPTFSSVARRWTTRSWTRPVTATGCASSSRAMRDRSTCSSRGGSPTSSTSSREADVVVVDSPPLTEFADAFALVDAVDIVLIAVRLGHSRRDRFADLNRFLSQHPVPPAGLVVTSQHRSRDVGLTPTTESLETLLSRRGGVGLERIGCQADG